MEEVLLKKKSMKKWCPLNTTQMLSQHVTRNIGICRKSQALFSSVAKDTHKKKKVKRGYSWAHTSLSDLHREEQSKYRRPWRNCSLQFILQYLPRDSLNDYFLSMESK